mgnify:CR=1 FL=1
MDFIFFQQHFSDAGSFRVVNAFARIQSAHLLHFLFGQCKIKNVDISGDSGRGGGFRQNDDSFLHFKAQDNLPAVLMIFFRQQCDEWMGKQFFISMAKRIACFQSDIIFGKEGA